MAYLKPSWLVRNVFNKLASSSGLAGTEVLVVTRRTGGEQAVPVIPVDHDGARYVVSARGESQWVRNLRAWGECELRSRRDSSRYRTEEVPVGQRSAIIDAYRAKAGRAVSGYWKQLPDEADHPTFRLNPTGAPTSASGAQTPSDLPMISFMISVVPP